MSAPKNNKNAVKDSSKKVAANLNIRCHPDDLLKWRTAAKNKQQPLTQWIVSVLNNNFGEQS
jgi:predicted HicB family RNase H-like nuclease